VDLADAAGAKQAKTNRHEFPPDGPGGLEPLRNEKTNRDKNEIFIPFSI
jgi:hypothetical protein